MLTYKDTTEPDVKGCNNIHLQNKLKETLYRYTIMDNKIDSKARNTVRGKEKMIHNLKIPFTY
jgi:hypothetical protein